jgi:hypothetical protein
MMESTDMINFLVYHSILKQLFIVWYPTKAEVVKLFLLHLG